jgi:integrase
MGPKATGQVIERKGKHGITYAARVRAYGERHYLSLGYSWHGYTRRQAETELENILADIRRGSWQPPQPEPAPASKSDPTFHVFASEWFEAKRHEVAPRSVEDYQWGLQLHLLPFFKDHHLSQITIAEVDRYKNGKVRERERATNGRGLSNRTINETLNLLAQILEIAVEYEHIQFNPARGRRRRLKAPPPKRTWLEPEQVKPLLDATYRGLRGGKRMPDPRMRTLFATAICTGLRIGELLALRWQDVDLANGHLTVVASKTEAGTGREIDLWPELHQELTRYKALRKPKPTDYVFATSSGRADTSSNVAKRLKRTVERANGALAGQQTAVIPTELSPHSLRRTFASLLYLRGENPVYVMHQMGHTDPKLALRIYTRVMGQQRRRGPGVRLTGVLDGARWVQTAADPGSEATIAA